MTYLRRKDKARIDHIAHEQVTNPFSILMIGFIDFLRFSEFRISRSHRARFFKDVENRNPILTGGFHANLSVGIMGKPIG